MFLTDFFEILKLVSCGKIDEILEGIGVCNKSHKISGIFLLPKPKYQIPHQNQPEFGACHLRVFT